NNFIPVGPPGFVVPGPDGQPIYAPIGYYPSQVGSRPGSGSGSQSFANSASPQKQSRGQPKRQFSGSESQQPYSSPRASPRPMPDDPSWQPRARSSSNLSYSAELHQQYQA